MHPNGNMWLLKNLCGLSLYLNVHAEQYYCLCYDVIKNVCWVIKAERGEKMTALNRQLYHLSLRAYTECHAFTERERLYASVNGR